MKQTLEISKPRDEQVSKHIMSVHQGRASGKCPFCRKHVFGE